MDVEAKQAEFNRAMALYDGAPWYRLFGLVVAVGNVALEALLLARASASGGAWAQLAALALAYPLADFVNGLVHMYMDNNDRYGGPAGPLAASFHLHHKLPRYRDRPLPAVFFLESGSKVWLLPCLALAAWYTAQPGASPFLTRLLAYFCLLSSVAEVSHYLAHNSLSPAAAALARAGLLLSKRHHGRHHIEDNVSYAFLNGWTDPLLDAIAARCYKGYKQGTDLHYARYEMAARE